MNRQLLNEYRRSEADKLDAARNNYRNDPLLWHLHDVNARTVTTAQRDAMIRLLNVLGYEVTKK